MYVHEKGIAQGLTSNGSSITRETMPFIKQYINDINISIDYPNKQQNNDFRGAEHAWDWAITACNLLKDESINFSIVTCLHALNSNKDNILRFLRMCKDYHCEWRVNWFKSTGRGKFDKELKLNPRKVHDIFRLIAENSIELLRNEISCSRGIRGARPAMRMQTLLLMPLHNSTQIMHT